MGIVKEIWNKKRTKHDTEFKMLREKIPQIT